MSALPEPCGPRSGTGADGSPLPRATFLELAGRAIHAARGIHIDPADLVWVRAILTPAELELWAAQSAYDRNHTVEVARRVERRLAPTAYGKDPLWPGAALMHDVGKLQSNLSLGERVVATLVSKLVGVATVRRWASSATGWTRRLGLYLIHGEVGAEMIRAAGGREEIAVWTEIHQGYRDIAGSGIPPIVVEALIESDVA